MLFGYWSFGIVPKHLWETDPSSKNPYATGTKPLIGTGPFRVKEFVRGSHAELVRYENYYRKGKPYLDRIVYKMIPDSSARVLALESGTVDHVNSYYVPYEAVPRLAVNPKLRVTYEGTEAMGSSYVLAFNLRRKILADVKVRKAIAHAIDLNEIRDKAFFGVGTLAVGPILSDWVWAYTRNVPIYDRNVARANSLLDEAGYPKGINGVRFKLDFYYEIERSELVKTAELMYSMLKDVGIKLELLPADTATCDKMVYVDRNYDLFCITASAGPDPQSYDKTLTTEAIQPLPRTNAASYSNPRVDEIFKASGATGDAKKRGELFRELQKIIAEELPYYWMLERRIAVAWNTEFVGLPVGVFGGREHYENVWWTKGTLPTVVTPALTRTVTATVEAVPTWSYAALAVAIVAVVVAGALALRRGRYGYERDESGKK
jgi:peptide/nickel transport system substrate-binding protein